MVFMASSSSWFSFFSWSFCHFSTIFSSFFPEVNRIFLTSSSWSLTLLIDLYIVSIGTQVVSHSLVEGIQHHVLVLLTRLAIHLCVCLLSLGCSWLKLINIRIQVTCFNWITTGLMIVEFHHSVVISYPW